MFLRDVAAASAVAAGVGLGPGATSLEAAELDHERQPDVSWKKTPCRLCGVGCGLLVGVQDGRAVAVKGDPDSPVGKGLACAKGYFSIQALYARDRITRARVRRDQALTDVPLGEALDLVANRIRETAALHGKDSIAVYGSAQWTIPDAYVASRLFKGALGTNNVETSSRLYGAAARAGLESSFGLDGAVGCYEDIEQADVFILWDVNLAETDPVLFSRMLDRRRTAPAVRIVDLATRTTRTSYAADLSLLHAPQTASTIANAICHEVVAHDWVDHEFVDRHVAFKRGRTEIGYDVPDGALLADRATSVSWDDYVAFLEDYTPVMAQRRSGLSAENIRWLATLYGDPTRKVMSVWGSNANQHARGTWQNNLLYNIHLLVGKIAAPGNAALGLTGQPGGGNGVQEAGTLTDTLPGGVVSKVADRERAAAIWGVPAAQIPSAPTHTLLAMLRALERGEIRFLWIQATNPMVSLPNLDRYRRAARRSGAFLVVSEVFPTPTSDLADVVLPAAMWFEREGIFANVERRLQHFDRMVAPPGDAMSDAGLMIEVAHRLGFQTLFPGAPSEQVARIWEEYRRFHEGPRSALPSLAELQARPGVIWPSVDGRETKWRYNSAHDPAADRARGAFDFYGHPDGRAWIWLRPQEPPAESPDRDYPLWLRTGAVLEHWGTGSMTQRIPTLHRAAPGAYVEIHPDDATALGVGHGEVVRLVSRRGALEVEARVNYRSQPPRGQIFVPTFDESAPVNRLKLDACCPLSGQPDTTVCAVRVERLPARRAPGVAPGVAPGAEP